MKTTNKFLIVYYGFIVIAILVTALLEYQVPAGLSIFTVLLIFLPLFKRFDYAPFVLSLFLLIGNQLNNTFFHPSFLQLFIVFYAVIYHKLGLSKVNVFVLVIFHFLFVNLISGEIGSFFIYAIIAVLFLGSLITRQDHVTQMSYAFIVSSLICSVFCIVKLKDISIGYDIDQLEENEFVLNPNKIACTIGLGIIAATMLLTDIINGIRTKNQKILVISGLVLPVFALGLLGSRGALIACAASSLLLLLLSPKTVSFKSKLIFFLLLIIFILYVTGIFDYLIYRMSDDKAKNMSGRPDIWAMKLEYYFNKTGILSKIIGIGKSGCFNIGYVSTHNDFVTALIGYGFIGVTLFIYTTLLPLFKDKTHKSLIFALLVFFIGECFVLEPIFRGYYNIMLYYLFVYSYVTVNK